MHIQTLKTQLPGCFWASLSCTWTPWCAPRTTSCKGIQPWCAFALLKDLHEWNRCWWGSKELLRSLFVSAENAGNSGIRCLWASVKGSGDPSPAPTPSPSPIGPRLSAVGLLMKEHADERAISCSLKIPPWSVPRPQRWNRTGRRDWKLAISWNAFSCQQNSHLQL